MCLAYQSGKTSTGYTYWSESIQFEGKKYIKEMICLIQCKLVLGKEMEKLLQERILKEWLMVTHLLDMTEKL